MNDRERRFADMVWSFYRAQGRHTLPWRKTANAYRILVSEVMLQQTQVDRVLPKYRSFLKAFPTVRALAHAPLKDVLIQWQGLGYNRRGKMLHTCAQVAVDAHNGRLPKNRAALEALPGIGPYTAGAIMAFAYNVPVPLIETNIRTVYLSHFFNDQTDVGDRQILQSIGVTLDKQNPREWYWALMDYGAHLKRTLGNQNGRSKYYTKQTRFAGSDRQIRGAILRVLATSTSTATRRRMHEILPAFDDVRIDVQLERLQEEGMVKASRGRYTLPD